MVWYGMGANPSYAPGSGSLLHFAGVQKDESRIKYCILSTFSKLKQLVVRGTRRLSYLAAVLIWQDNFTR